MNKYKGWIPTVGERLSFSIIGKTNHPTRAVTANCADCASRKIICFQKRPMNDSALPFFKAQLAKTLSQNGIFWFVFVAAGGNCSTTDSEQLTGSIYIFSQKKEWKNTVPKIKDAQEQLYSHSLNEHVSPLDEFYQERVSAHLDTLEEKCHYALNVIN